jgi:hypothetical protein
MRTHRMDALTTGSAMSAPHTETSMTERGVIHLPDVLGRIARSARGNDEGAHPTVGPLERFNNRSRPGEGVAHVAVQVTDDVERDALGARRRALADVGAAAETLVVHLLDHAQDARVTLGLALRQQTEMRDLRRGEQHRRAVGARRDAGAAADAGRRLERVVGVLLRHRDVVRLRRRAGRRRDVAAGLDDAVEGAAVDDEILDDGEGPGTPRLDVDDVAIVERAHVQLARRGDFGAVRDAVDHDTARTADALATVGVERHRLLALEGQPLVEDVEHLEERHVLADVLQAVGDHLTLGLGVLLAPDTNGDLHL